MHLASGRLPEKTLAVPIGVFSLKVPCVQYPGKMVCRQNLKYLIPAHTHSRCDLARYRYVRDRYCAEGFRFAVHSPAIFG